MRQYAVGIDVGGTTIKFGIFDREGGLLKKREIPTKKGGKEEFFSDLWESVQAAIHEEQIGKEEILGIGMGVPAAVAEDGHMARMVNIGLDEMYPAKELEDRIQIPVRVTNDANAAAYGEMWKGAAKGCDNVVMVTLGTGVGGGIISGGRILNGATGGGGEIGHMHVEDREEERCKCGNKGCLEQYASATGIVRLAKARLSEDETESILRGNEVTAKSIFDAARKKDPLAQEVVRKFGYYLAKGMGAICCVVNPDTVVIGGGVSRAGQILLDAVVPRFPEFVFPACKNVRFKLAELGNDAGIYGAAALFLYRPC